ncbi:MAG: GNAT family N-acetyltransferase [Pseudomonadota bacterium]|nr:GNAT family N-acetyltransferase [Pseudomonadota bacterium]
MDVVVRRAEPEDAEGLRSLYERAPVFADTLQLPFPSTRLWKERLASFDEHFHFLVATLNDELVGSLGLEQCRSPRRRHVATFGMGVRDDVQGQGVGRALMASMLDLCDNWLAVTRIELTVYVDNARAVAPYQRFGFDIEGESRHFAFRNGTYVSAYSMARVNDQTAQGDLPR